MTVKNQKTMQLGLTYVIFKGDSQNTVKAVHNNPNSSFCETQSLVMDILSMLSNFVWWDFCHVNVTRNYNFVAHKTKPVHLDKTYLTETENWKHYSKIIFKYMNSTVRLIFNKKVIKK